MTIQELLDDERFRSYIASFVNDQRFLVVKDAFMSHTPSSAGRTGTDAIVLAYGQNLGTRYVFNKMEELARPTKPKNENKRPESTGNDPDLQDE